MSRAETVVRSLTGAQFDDALARIRLERDMAEVEARVAAHLRNERKNQVIEALSAGQWVCFGAAS